MNDITAMRPPVLTIRSARPEDLEALCLMIEEFAAHQGESAGTSAQALARDLFGPQPWIRALLAADGEGLVGYAILTPAYRANEGARGLEIHQLYVRPAFRGHGAGRHLVSMAREEARRLGCAYMTVGATTGNVRAHRFYETMAFIPRPVTGMRYLKALAG